ncbi:MAG: GNAT family N-acetyltransferase [Pseudomonadota bacterium]|nr:GNAT family N-acetyltransferase [Pseudomonadota bacterium]
MPVDFELDAVDIRPAASGDLAAIHAIYAESVLNGTATYELKPPPPEEMRARFGAITANGYPWLVASAHERIAGYAYASAFRTRPAYRWLVEDSIYLAPEARGRGIGGKLLARLLADCERLGFRQMVAVIGGAHPASIALHRAAGFNACGRMKATGYKFGRWLDTELMQIALGEGDSIPPDEGAYPGNLFMP